MAQQKVCTMLVEALHALFNRLANVTIDMTTPSDNEIDVKKPSDLVPLARDIGSNTDRLRSLKSEVDDFIKRLEN